MNPYKSLMGFLIALILAISPTAVVAREDWAPISTAGGQTFYLPKASLEDLKQKESGSENLYTKEEKSSKSAAVLEKDKQGKYWINLNGHNYRAQASFEKPAKKPEAEKESRPKGVDEKVWNVVLNSPAVPKERKAAVARAFQKLNTTDRKAFQSLIAAKPEAIDEALGKTAGWLAENEELANDENAAAQLASVVVSEDSRGGGGGQTEKPLEVKGKPVLNPDGTLAGEANPVNILTKLLKQKPEAGKDVAARLSRFMLSQAPEQAYVMPELLADPAAKMKERLGPAAVNEGWVAKKLSDPKEPNGAQQVAALYFVMGEDGELPPWAASDEVLNHALKAPLSFRGQLVTNMSPWTGSAEEYKAKNPNVFPHGQYSTNQRPEDWIPGFFNDAAGHAEKILSDPRVNGEIAASIKKFFEDFNKPFEPGEKGVRVDQGKGMKDKDLAVSAFDFEGLYVNGAVVKMIPIPGTKPTTYRRISLKIFTAREGDVMVHKLGIYDISEPGSDDGTTPSRMFGQKFSLDKTGENVFRLDDRRPDSLQYKLKIAEDGSISFGGAESKESEIQTSLAELHKRRSGQVSRDGELWKIGGKHFKVIGQGGKKGAWLYFRSDKSGKLAGENSGIDPELMAEVNQVGPGGRPTLIKGPTRLGMVGKQNYNLQWNEDKKYFEAVAGDPPKDEPKKDEGKKEEGKKEEGKKEEGKKEEGKKDEPKKDENQPAAWSSDCTEKVDKDSAEGHLGKFTFFVNKVDKNGTFFRLCLNNSQLVLVSGVLVSGGLREETKDGKNFLVVDVAAPGNKNSFIHPDSLKEGQVPESNIPTGGSGSPEFAGRTMFYIPTSNLSSDKVASAAPSGHYATPDRLAAVSLIHNVQKKQVTSMEVFVRDSADDPEAAKSAVGWALGAFGKGTPLDKMLGDKNNQDKLDGYILAEAGKYKGKGLGIEDRFTIELYWYKEELENNNIRNAVYASYIVPGVTTDDLVYCATGGSGVHLETRSEHKGGSLHK